MKLYWDVYYSGVDFCLIAPDGTVLETWTIDCDESDLQFWLETKVNK